MSKSKKNTIDPESIIKNYGADSVRLFILSDSPPEKDVQWSDQGMMASFKFVQKLWALNSKILEKIKKIDDGNEGENITKFTNQLIYKITQNLEKFHYNVIVANFYEMYNFLIKEIEKPIKKEILIENYKKILILMSPFIPHFAAECLANLNEKKINWPIVAKEELIEDEVNFVVQINGKKRAILKVNRDIDENSILNKIKSNNETEKLLQNKKIKKTIFVSNRLINIII
jgi:leucyl-tRNA synthetase